MSVHVFCLQYVMCYTDLFVVGVLQLVILLPRGVCAKIYECGTFICGVVLVTVTTIFGLGRCVHLNFLPKRRVFVGLVLRLHLYCVSGALLVKGV